MFRKVKELRGFRQEVDDFVFFHLGSDADVTVEAGDSLVEVCIDHPRVRPIRFRIDEDELSRLAADSRALEQFLLDHLTENRKA